MDSWSLFSIEPNDSSGQVDRSEEISSGLVVARSNCPVLLELATPSDGAPWTSPCQRCAGPFDCSWVGLRTVFLPQARVRSRAGRHRRLYPPVGFRPACEAAAHRLLPNHGLGPQSGKTRWDCPVRRPWRGFWYSIRPCCARSLGPGRLFLGPGTVLVRAHNGAVDHGVFIVRIGSQNLEHLLPHLTLAQRENRV